MADNTVITPGTGRTIRTDDVGGVHYQVVKLDAGGDGASAPVTAAAPLPVTLDATQEAYLAYSATQDRQGSLTEAAPATDTASSGINGRLQRIAQRLTSVIAKLPALGTAGSPSADVITVQGAASGGIPVPTGDYVSVVTATPTLDTSAYTSGDSLHTAVIAFAAAVGANKSGIIKKMVIVDAAGQSVACELWLFSDTVTPAAANAAHSITDADALKCIGVIPSGTYYASALNSVSVVTSISVPVKVAAATIYGILVTRGTPTYAANSLAVTLYIAVD